MPYLTSANGIFISNKHNQLPKEKNRKANEYNSKSIKTNMRSAN